MTYSRDGTRRIDPSSDKTAQVWEAQTGRQLAEPQGPWGQRRFDRDV